MKQLTQALLMLIFLGVLFSSCKEDDPIQPNVNPNDTIPGFEGYTLKWNDEFNESAINSSNWGYETGDGTDYGLPAGWGNNELQLYTDTPENSFIEKDADGVSALVIAATEAGTGNYRSAKLTTQGLQSFRYGKIEARIKLPTAQGMWPALWMLGDNITEISWPGCGEVDILELVGSEPDVVHANIHYTDGDNKYSNDEGSPKMINETFNQNYHHFSIDWTPTEITFSLDGTVFKTTSISDDGMKEFHRSFYLILNVAVGGSWPGNPDASTSFPQKMYIDYIRYYTKDGFTAPAAPPLNIEEETVGQFIDPNIADNAIKEGFTEIDSLEVNVYGPAAPLVSTSDTAIDGAASVAHDFPGGGWGGAFYQLPEPIDLSAYSYIKFSLNKPATVANLEIKLESPALGVSVFLKDYISTPVSNGFEEYSIPLSDFVDLDLTQIHIPFATWNAQDEAGGFVEALILVDNIYFTN